MVTTKLENVHRAPFALLALTKLCSLKVHINPLSRQLLLLLRLHRPLFLNQDKLCRTAGETIVASYENIQRQGVWSGVFPVEFQKFETQNLLAWSFLCGFNDTTDSHTWASMGGADLSTAKLTPWC
jgi:hypothetical protein